MFPSSVAFFDSPDFSDHAAISVTLDPSMIRTKNLSNSIIIYCITLILLLLCALVGSLSMLQVLLCSELQEN